MTEPVDMHAKVRAAIYKPLNTDIHEIRVLHLQRGKRDTPVRCSLHVVSLPSGEDADLPVYDALSYTWGSDSEKRTVLVEVGSEKHELPVTNNLHAALRNMRPRWGKPTVLWVDAISINQSDNEERSTQVAGMGKVYASAQCVRVWLGEPLTRINRPVFFYWQYLLKCVRILPYLRHSYRKGFRRVINPKVHVMNDALESAEQIWHSRAWVMQEFCLGRTVRYHAGKCRLKDPCEHTSGMGLHLWDDLVNERFSALSLDRVRELEKATFLWDTYHLRTSTLLDLAVDAGQTDASDPRDKVYSLLGLQGRIPTFIEIIPDYDLPICDVYAQATMRIIQDLGDLSYLSLCAVRQKNLTLPSWTIDFTFFPEPVGRVFIFFPHSDQDTILTAHLPNLDLDGRSLIVSGWISSSVRATRTLRMACPVSGSPETMKPVFEQLWAQYTSLLMDESQAVVDPVKPQRLSSPLFWESLNKLADHWRIHCLGQHPTSFDTSTWFSQVLDIDWLDGIRQPELPGQLALAVTSNGHFGLIPAWCEEGDVVVYTPSHCLPLILRKCGDSWTFQALAYIDDLELDEIKRTGSWFDDLGEFRKWAAQKPLERLRLV